MDKWTKSWTVDCHGRFRMARIKPLAELLRKPCTGMLNDMHWCCTEDQRSLLQKDWWKPVPLGGLAGDNNQEPSHSWTKSLIALLLCCVTFITWFYCDNFITGLFVTCLVTVFECNHVIKISHDCTKFAMVTIKNCYIFITGFIITCFVTAFEHNHVIRISHVFITAF